MICLILARSGSKSVKDKNIKLLGGKPLLVWSIETAIQCGLDPFVSSDSREYLKIAEEAGANLLIRPESLAQDSTTTYQVLAHHVPILANTCKEENFVLLQPTSPFRHREDVLLGIRKFYKGEYTSVISAVPIPDRFHPEEAIIDHGHHIKMATGTEIKDRKTRRQDYLPAHVPSGSFYVFKAANLEGGNFYGDKPGLYATRDDGININNEADFDLAAELALTWKP
jgi:N-acylneuraminate cytidylyltransferase